MTKQKKIQSLIADIDSLLAKFGSRFPWSKPNDLARDREILEQVRRYLLSMQSDEMAMSPSPESAITPIVQAVAQEMESIRQQVTEPLQTELSALRQQRESLTQEIQHLEQKKQQLQNTVTAKGGGQEQPLPEFAQDLIHQSTERLTQQLAQILLNLEAQLLNASSTSGSPGQPASGIMLPQERLEQLRQLQRESDRMLLNLDANQRSLFDALDRDLHGYQQSLSQGLDKMHRLSNQGELLFTALVNRLAQLLGRETSTLVQSSQPWSEVTELSQSVPDSTSSTSKQEGIFVGIDPVSQPEFNVTLSANALTPSPPIQAQLPSKIADQQWTEELDTENLGGNPLDALIGWDMDTSISDKDSEFQDLDFLLGIDSTPESTPSSSPISQADDTQPVEPEVADQTEVENRHHEIDELYNTLFGTDAVPDSNTPPPANTAEVTDTNTSATSITTTEGQDERSPDQAFGETESVEIADYLFDGFTDPADETSVSEPWIEGINQDQLSWETLLFETPTPDVPIESEIVATPEPATYPHQERFGESQDVKTITALTDLLDEMGLSYSPAVADIPSIGATREEEWFLEHPGETDSPVTSVEDHYIPASPDEDLLVRDESQQFSGQEIRLDQSTLQQLSEDLHSFEAEDHLNIVPQPSPSRDRTVSPPNFDLDSIQSLPMSEELLAEDWEEFALHDLSQEDVTFPDWQQTSPTDRDSREPDPLVSDSEKTTPPPSPELDDVYDDLSEESIDLEQDNVVKEYVLEDSVTPDQQSVSQPQETSLEDGEQNRD
ncbi:hypothetical protein MC7420_6198 [Coleofasciculus chthonoplastes PCC 7420]|uniref:Uncharacterized protein n=1 Tax=Coleofasciculus chthonoplastes PCC 7420 TaxID=118168 RepID=B4VU42_9CYAN|nr:hypothetical protein [Coleofasciculus chthonoplastes]EDX74720.1 hypothetical protein MC7420_6198 [Coleofasciculus chthonoplastes PCC 7420]